MTSGDFGWQLQHDLDSAKDLGWYCNSKSKTAPLWSKGGRQRTLLELQEGLISGPLTVLGAAAEPGDVRDAIVGGQRIIAADGAVGVLNESEYPGIAWDALLCVVSDGDGDMADLAMAAERGVPFVLHAHGDNIQQWIKLLDVLLLQAHRSSLPTKPAELEGIQPWWFTDGHRAVCFCLPQMWRKHQTQRFSDGINRPLD